MIRPLLSTALFAAILLFLGCGSDNSTGSHPGSPVLVHQLDYGCQGHQDSVAFRTGSAWLNGYEFDGDTLTLDIHFEANCCPAFVESALLYEHAIAIEAADTLFGCRCMCDYDNEFLVPWSTPGQVAVSFKSTAPEHDPALICSFDTLLTLE